MTQKLFEEALADARAVTEVAENNAKQAVLDAVLPRIKRLIENELLGDDFKSSDTSSAEDILTDEEAVNDLDLGDSVSASDEEGKVTLDLDALNVDPDSDVAIKTGDEEFELNMESRNALKALKLGTNKNLENHVKIIENAVNKYGTDKKVTAEQISQLISKIEHTYEYVHESLNESNVKKTYEFKLEKLFQELNKIQETLMKRMNEEEEMDLDVDAEGDDVDLDAVDAGSDGDNELTLKLTGLPDDLDLDGVGVDLIGSDDDGDSDLGGDDDVSGDDEVLDLDLDSGDDGQSADDVDVQEEGSQVVEIDESMLRREIHRMAQLREAAEAQTDNSGFGVGPDEFDDFGDATEEGEPLDLGVKLGDVTETRRSLRQESIRQAKCRQRLTSLKREATRSRGHKLVSIKENYNRVLKMFNESVKRAKQFRSRLTEASRVKSTQSRRSNSNVSQQADKAVQNLRTKLAESNLRSVKLAYANKVLQSESLNSRQRAQVIKALDECKTPREAKLVYTSVVRRLSDSQRNLKEGKVIGSSSRATGKSGSSNLNEGFQTERWSQLAGIK